MDRLGHYLKPGVKATAPAVLFSVVVSPRISYGGRGEHDQFHDWGGADVYCAHRKGPKWGRFASARCHTPDALWRWVKAHSDKHRRNYVILPDGQAGAAMSGLWDHTDNGQVKYKPGGAVGQPGRADTKAPGDTLVRRVVANPRTFLLDWARDGWRWVYLSARQYFGAPEQLLAQAVGFVWPDTGHLDQPGATVTRTAADRAALWLKVFMVLADWWLANTKAPFGLTASALSMGVIRTYAKAKYLCTHTDPDVLWLERAACFGGRAQTYYYGDVGDPRACERPNHPAPARSPYGSIPGPLTQLDVRSMYPWLLREMEYPRKLKSYRENATASEPQAIARVAGVVARVTVETDHADYPERVGDRIYYRRGRFTTTLCGPELLDLHGRGRVVKCHSMAVYHMGRPFQAAASAMIAMRIEAREAQNLAWELFAKTLGVGMAGKLAQRTGSWVPRCDMRAPMRFGEWLSVRRTAKRPSRFRAIAGIVWEWVPDETGAGPHTAAFAYLAAYGRVHLRRLRDALPAQSVVSVDTDGLWVLSEGYRFAEEFMFHDSSDAGSVRVSDRSVAARFFGPRHYFTDREWVLAGFSAPSVSDRGRMVLDTQRLTAIAGPAGSAPRGASVRGRTSTLALDSPGLKIGRDGWATATTRR